MSARCSAAAPRDYAPAPSAALHDDLEPLQPPEPAGHPVRDARSSVELRIFRNLDADPSRLTVFGKRLATTCTNCVSCVGPRQRLRVKKL
jgi:hypothetical protein